MEKEFIPYAEALALKELGFNQKCLGQYNISQGDKWIFSIDLSGEGQYPLTSPACITPLYQQAFRWFREKYDLHVFFPMLGANLISFEIKSFGNKNGNCVQNVYDGIVYDNLYYQPEEAELECLKKLIELCKK